MVEHEGAQDLGRLPAHQHRGVVNPTADRLVEPQEHRADRGGPAILAPQHRRRRALLHRRLHAGLKGAPEHVEADLAHPGGLVPEAHVDGLLHRLHRQHGAVDVDDIAECSYGRLAHGGRRAIRLDDDAVQGRLAQTFELGVAELAVSLVDGEWHQDPAATRAAPAAPLTAQQRPGHPATRQEALQGGVLANLALGLASLPRVVPEFRRALPVRPRGRLGPVTDQEAPGVDRMACGEHAGGQRHRAPALHWGASCWHRPLVLQVGHDQVPEDDVIGEATEARLVLVCGREEQLCIPGPHSLRRCCPRHLTAVLHGHPQGDVLHQALVPRHLLRRRGPRRQPDAGLLGLYVVVPEPRKHLAHQFQRVLSREGVRGHLLLLRLDYTYQLLRERAQQRWRTRPGWLVGDQQKFVHQLVEDRPHLVVARAREQQPMNQPAGQLDDGHLSRTAPAEDDRKVGLRGGPQRLAQGQAGALRQPQQQMRPH